MNMITTAFKKLSFLLAFTAVAFYAPAQNRTFEKIAERYDSVEYVYINSPMLKSIAGTKFGDNPENPLHNTVRDLKSLELLSCTVPEICDSIAPMLADVSNGLDLMSTIKNDGDHVNIYAKGNGELLNKLFMLVRSSDGTIQAVYITGQLQPTVIKSIMPSTEKQP